MLDAASDRDSKPDSRRPVVVVIGPPWPMSGASRIFRNQIDYYHQRGFRTVFVIVPFHRAFTRSSPIWTGIAEGIADIGADEIVSAPLDEKRYQMAKYLASIKFRFRGSALDWMYAIANSAPLPASLISELGRAAVALFHVNYVQSLGFAGRLRKELQGPGRTIPIILETHDIQSKLLVERSEANPWTRKPDAESILLRSEISMLRQADALVHLSVDDFIFFEKKMPEKRHFLALPAIDQAFISAVNISPALDERIDILFVGQNHFPNVEAVKWFLESVWPLLAHRELRFKIVGPVGSLLKDYFPELHGKFVDHFEGYAPNLGSFYNASRCVIAPMVSGSGTSIKTIEALALGKPFVGTSKAFRGMPMDRILDAGVHPYDSPSAFADAVVRVLGDTRTAGEMSKAAYEKAFSVAANFAARDESVNAVMSERGELAFTPAQ